MILFDPDLDSDPTLNSVSAKPAGARAHSPLPSARTLSRFLCRAQAMVRLRGQVNVLLTTDSAIRSLNRRFRGKNNSTDVLSFPAEEFIHNTEKIAGDLAISAPTAARQAGAEGHTLSAEIKVLILHGLLHLAGYDHEADEGQMARRESLLRMRLNLPQGLIERTGQVPPPKVRRATSVRPATVSKGRGRP
jgi:probable rRNA maturation factor